MGGFLLGEGGWGWRVGRGIVRMDLIFWGWIFGGWVYRGEEGGKVDVMGFRWIWILDYL